MASQTADFVEDFAVGVIPDVAEKAAFSAIRWKKSKNRLLHIETFPGM